MKKSIRILAATALISASLVDTQHATIGGSGYKIKPRKRRYALTPKQIKCRAKAKRAKQARKINYKKQKL